MRISDWSSDVCSSDLGARSAVIFGDQPGRLRRPLETRSQREAGFEKEGERRLLGDGFPRFGQARARAARRAAGHLAAAALDPRGALAVTLHLFGLAELNAKVEGDRVEPAPNGDASAPSLPRPLLPDAHPPHPTANT